MSRLHVLSSPDGFVGAYSTQDEAAKCASRYPGIPFVIQRFPVAESKDDQIWIIPFRDSGAVAFASNDRDEALKGKAAYDTVGWTFASDTVDQYQTVLGSVGGATQARLTALSDAAGAALSVAGVSGAISAQISIVDFIVPYIVAGESDSADPSEPASEAPEPAPETPEPVPVPETPEAAPKNEPVVV